MLWRLFKTQTGVSCTLLYKAVLIIAKNLLRIPIEKLLTFATHFVQINAGSNATTDTLLNSLLSIGLVLSCTWNDKDNIALLFIKIPCQ